jgi:uncharacterized membrane protein YgdD (TMEM256/DUF423 family)
MAKVFIAIGALAGLLAVMLGAFGAHALRGQIDENLLVTFNTGAQYQMYHALALLMVGVLVQLFPGHKLLNWSGLFFVAGMLLFSGSLYALALTEIKWFGPVTPVGGLAFMVGWLLLAFATTKFKAVKI